MNNVIEDNQLCERSFFLSVPIFSDCLLLTTYISKMNVACNWTVKNNTPLQRITSITESAQSAYFLFEIK